ncbi:MAG: YdcF family protein [Firmicutes bacterium]|nr:YdcF family protein [Bacillota bacterium]
MKMILKLLGILCILYGLGVNALVTSRSWFNWIFCILGAAFLALGFLWKHIVKLPWAAKGILLLAVFLCIVNFAAAEARIIKAAKSLPGENAKWVVILGAKVNDSGVSLEFGRRIDAAADFAKKHEGAIIVTTGGRGSDEPMSEGEAACERLLSLGIDKDRIVVEKKSDSTRENFEFAKDLMKERGYSEGDEIIIVSSEFHLYRAGKIAKAAGFEDISYIGVQGKAFLLPQYYFREYAALLFESVKGYY